MSNGGGLPTGWELRRIDELGAVQLGRQRSPGKRSDKFPTKYLRAANVTWNGLALDDVLDMDFTPTERETFRLRGGDILLSEASGSASEVGKPALWNDELELCCFQNTLIRSGGADAAIRAAPLQPLGAFRHLRQGKPWRGYSPHRRPTFLGP
jgi:type I restriction enzyme, S subunit